MELRYLVLYVLYYILYNTVLSIVEPWWEVAEGAAAAVAEAAET